MAPNKDIDRLARVVMRAPGLLRRAAATQAKEPEERWMLAQADDVRESYVREVLEPRLDG